MKSSQLHILKQGHLKKIIDIASLTSKISHKEGVAEAIVAACNKASKAIVQQRKNLYKDLEDFDYNIEVEHKAPTPKETGDDSLVAETAILVLVNQILKDNESVIAGKIVNDMTNKKLSDIKLYEDPAVDILEALLDIHAEVSSQFPETGQEKKEVITHTLTENDFDNNPDLNNAGLNVGDEVEIPKKDLDFDALTEKIIEDQQALPPQEESKEKEAEEPFEF